ncbi:hypothetical protein GF108_17075 [Phyllobacterium sp. SYP-B3895]|uniref:Uncharacterized protein n=1 Tax=Phyllobacterium pellucidum TaxID=2740464 RepID=A0A849VMW2_9HYPH|nr:MULTISPECIES: hypothetical protein [Phyllobacterium]MRG57290.1 hypothetical protein [Phyllobacterium sp. SYP-B3895]NTS31232.1 hypothetical protein [Phyllobacterium pellucidum]UGY08838.1 hypothetical protein LLE51_012460 [Phyllobacterium sp. T1018]
MPILRHKPSAPRMGGGKTSSNSADVPHGEMMDAILIPHGSFSDRRLTFRHHFTDSPSIAGNLSNDCWNDVQDIEVPAMAALSEQRGGDWARKVAMARIDAATQLIRAKEDCCHGHC